jgi:hypothetical protein
MGRFLPANQFGPLGVRPSHEKWKPSSMRLILIGVRVPRKQGEIHFEIKNHYCPVNSKNRTFHNLLTHKLLESHVEISAKSGVGFKSKKEQLR